MSALHELLTQIVDYAGLFPPAALSLPTVVENYDQYRKGPAEWALSRIIIPAARLEEFKSAAESRLTADQPWNISALIPPVSAPESGFQKAIQRINEFNAEKCGALVDAIEVKCPEVEHVEIIAKAVPAELSAFLEVPHVDDPNEHIGAIGQADVLFAKIRTGSVDPALIPSTEQVARFINRCGENQVGFKATAGLHHPIRNEYKLTYEPDSVTGTMHGYLNVFLAAAFAFSGAKTEITQQILESRSVGDFTFSDQQIQFADQVVSLEQIKQLRSNKMISFGSCSFEEPIADLRALGFEAEIEPAI